MPPHKHESKKRIPMKKALLATIIGISILACPFIYFMVGPQFDPAQIETLKVLVGVTTCSAIYCFVVGEITRNNSQMDKLWSLLPIAYTWIIAVMSDMAVRPVVMAVLATIWGTRLTFNFARKGAYSIRFWSGEEDYRWIVLRGKKEFQPRWKWMIFDLLFISIYQNALVLIITLPALLTINSDQPFGLVDILATVMTLGFIIYETVADEQQWRFHSKKHALMKEGKTLEQLPAPYNKGFNTTGLWKVSRHPNYFAEQAIWASFYIFSIGAGYSVFNWSIIGPLLLIVLFLGSSMFGEEVSGSKYPEYKQYCQEVSKFFPGKRYSR